MFISKNVLLIQAGKTVIIYDVKTQKENILVIGGSTLNPDNGGSLPLNGIGCVDCCGKDLLALAEHPPMSKVIVCLYPDLKVLATLIGE